MSKPKEPKRCYAERANGEGDKQRRMTSSRKPALSERCWMSVPDTSVLETAELLKRCTSILRNGTRIFKPGPVVFLVIVQKGFQRGNGLDVLESRERVDGVDPNSNRAREAT